MLGAKVHMKADHELEVERMKAKASKTPLWRSEGSLLAK